MTKHWEHISVPNPPLNKLIRDVSGRGKNLVSVAPNRNCDGADGKVSGEMLSFCVFLLTFRCF